MKGEKWVTCVLAFLLAFSASLGAVGCMVTAFSLPLARFPAVVLACAGSALLCAGAFSRKRGGLVLLCLAALGAGWLWRRGEAARQLWQLVYRITYIYNRAYGWGVFRLVDTSWDAGTVDWPTGILGAVIALTVARSVCRGQGTLLTIFLSLLPLASCLVVTDTVPAGGYLLCLLWPLILLLLTGRVRAGDSHQGNRLTLLAAVPTALALAGLLLAVPQKSYVNRAGELRESLLAWTQSLPETAGETLRELAPGTVAGEPDSVDLASLGRRIESTQPVMDVTAEVGGALYLRGQDYDMYDGRGWSASRHRVEDFSCRGIDLGSVTIQTVRSMEELYLPYYPQEAQSLVGGRMDNSRLYTGYTFSRSGLPDSWRSEALAGANTSHPFADGAEENQSRYLALPDAARTGAAPLLEEILEGKTSPTEKAEAIASFVRGSARYDKNTGRMPGGQEDFALWFLMESDTGYCVHFATAAAVLLRAAGVEARYVSGYLVRLRPGQTVTVTGENAHAWAEYYEPALNTWLVLEATPAVEETPAGVPGAVPETAPVPTTEAQPQASSEAPAQTGTEPDPRPSQSPSGGPSTEPVPEPSGNRFGIVGIWLLLIAAAAAGLQGQRRLRLRLRRRRQRRGTPNAQALARWQETLLVARLLGETPPGELEALAQKAKFSQHTLGPEELAAFDSYLRGGKKRLRQMSWYRRLLYQYLYAVC